MTHYITTELRKVCGHDSYSGDGCLNCEAADEIERLHRSRNFYMRRCEALQAVQDQMRDPERKAVCDILANGSTDAMNGANA